MTLFSRTIFIFFVTATCIAGFAELPTKPAPGEPFQLATSYELLRKNAVLNGTVADQKSAITRFTVLIKKWHQDGKYAGSCSGIIVTNSLILTAGHCFTSSKMTINVHFGSGGQSGFTHIERALEYRTLYRPVYGNDQKAKSDSASRYLNYNIKSHTRYLIDRLARTNWHNEADRKHFTYDFFVDIALIKINTLPKGYAPIRIYNGGFKYNMTAFIGGFGINDRTLEKRDQTLRWKKVNLIGHFTRPKEPTLAFEVFTPDNGGFCYGDSGGPLIAHTGNNNFALIGVNVMLTNNCANSSYAVYVHHFKEWLQQTAQKLGSSIEI